MHSKPTSESYLSLFYELKNQINKQKGVVFRHTIVRKRTELEDFKICETEFQPKSPLITYLPFFHSTYSAMCTCTVQCTMCNVQCPMWTGGGLVAQPLLAGFLLLL